MTAGAATAAAVVVALVCAALLPGSDDDAESVAVAPLTSARAGTTAETPRRTDSPSPSATSKATKKAKATKKPAPAKSPAAEATRTTAPPAVPSAGRIRPGVTRQGVATHYEAGNGDGACLFGASDDMMIAAMNTADYETSRACGAYVLVRATNGRSVTVKITNECPLPCAPGQLDLSKEAFAELADLKQGRIQISWSLLSPDTSDTISFRYKTGSSVHWCGIQVIDHRNPVTGLEVRTTGGWRKLPRTDYNYFLAEDGNGCGGAIRVTDLYGEQLTVEGIAVRPDVVQPTKVQFSRR
ncbi:expansin EXLX1 family cellulose-binding protein [Streptomyces sp. NPDC003635]